MHQLGRAAVAACGFAWASLFGFAAVALRERLELEPVGIHLGVVAEDERRVASGAVTRARVDLA